MRTPEFTSADEQPTWRYWGEEKADGAVFTVYLKKVRYHTPSKSVTTESEDDISHLEWETVRVRFVKAGTLAKLVECLASDTGELESTYISVFLATYRTFASPKQVLNLLIERYEFLNNCGISFEERPNNSEVTTSSPPPPVSSEPRIRADVREQHCKTLRLALHVWMDQYPEDFREPPNYPCLNQLEAFCNRTLTGSELDEKVKKKGMHIRRPLPPPPPSHLSALPSPGHAPFKSNRQASPPPMVLKSSHTFLADTSSSVVPTRGGVSSSSNGGAPPLPPKPITRPYGHPVVPAYGDFLEIPDQIFAQQLTRMDCEVFKRLIPHQCLGSVWSRRDKISRDKDAATVVATVDQFNAVSFRSISTVLILPGNRSYGRDKAAQHRGKVIAKWVDVAQELRVLKNFSSLKAILSGLQSNPVHRLKRAWSHVSREKVQIFEELARIFNGENNALAQRELLVREGTARFADTVGENDHQMQKVLQKHSENSRGINYGTIPYLGTFLTDLTMVDTAIEDVTPDGLINFDKRRKEFEIIAQIKLIQGAANAYQIETQEAFSRWFESVLLLDERQAFELSCQIEPLPPSLSNCGGGGGGTVAARDNKYKRKAAGTTIGSYHRKNDSIASAASSSSESQFCSSEVEQASDHSTTTVSRETEDATSGRRSCANAVDEADISGNDGAAGTFEDKSANASRRRGSCFSSVSSSCGSCSLDASLASSSNVARSEPIGNSTPNRSQKTTCVRSGGAKSNSAAPSTSSTSSRKHPSQTPTTPDSPYRTSDFYIIRVSVETSGPETEGVIMYKSIMVSNHERTGSVIRSAMVKHGLEGSPENYTLSQLLPDRELAIPAGANVYYAINTQHDLNFVLREIPEKSDASASNSSARIFPGNDGANGVTATATAKTSRKASRDTSKVRRKLLGLSL